MCTCICICSLVVVDVKVCKALVIVNSVYILILYIIQCKPPPNYYSDMEKECLGRRPALAITLN